MSRIVWSAAIAASVAVGVVRPVARAAAIDGQAVAKVERLTPVAELPASIAKTLREPVGCVETSTGELRVLDRGAGAIVAIDAARTRATAVVRTGIGQGELLQPAALAIGPDDLIAAADSRSDVDRVQYFSAAGSRLGGFYISAEGRGMRVVLQGVVLNGIGSLQFAGRSFFVNAPWRGVLVSELDAEGRTLRQFGTPRATGQAADRRLDALLNTGVPLVDPTGGFYFVFQTGVPLFRKYDASGTLLYERHIEGPELDPVIQGLPTVFPTFGPGESRMPVPPVTVRAAGVDRAGRLWVALVEPFTYVYDARGEKVRSLQFDAGGVFAPDSLFFTAAGRVLAGPACDAFDAG